MRLFKSLKPAAALAAISLITASATELRAGNEPQDRLITVSATGYASAASDRARLTTGVVSEAATARAALASNTEAMQKVISGLKDSGIDGKDIRTGNFRIEPRYTTDKGAANIDGYRVTNEVEVLIRDLKSLGGLIDKLASLGSNQVHGLTFEVSKAEMLKDEARKEAVANARRRAELLAAAVGASVGDVVSISEEVSSHARPVSMSQRAEARFVPIESGTETLEASVTITWKLK